MIAMHTDRIYANRYSLVGSIGAMLDGWDVHRALERLEVTQRVYTSGQFKSMLSPFLPMSPEAEDKARQLVHQGGATFLADLKVTRGPFLKAGIAYDSGEVWLGEEAKRIGLIDEIGTLDEVISINWGIKLYDFGPSNEGFGQWSSTSRDFAEAIADAMLTHLSVRLR